MKEEKIITLDDDAKNALENGKFIVIKWRENLYLKVEKYTVEEQLQDELFGDTPTVIFTPHIKIKTDKKKSA